MYTLVRSGAVVLTDHATLQAGYLPPGTATGMMTDQCFDPKVTKGRILPCPADPATEAN